MVKQETAKYKLPPGWTPLRFEMALRLYEATRDRGYIFDFALVKRLFPYMSRISLFRRLQGLKTAGGIVECAKGSYRLSDVAVKLVEGYLEYLKVTRGVGETVEVGDGREG